MMNGTNKEDITPPDSESAEETTLDVVLDIAEEKGKAITEKEKKQEKPLASIREVFSFGAGRKKQVCLVVGFACSFISGCIFPVMAWLFAGSFQELGGVVTDEDFLKQVRKMAYSFMILGVVSFFSMSGQATFLETSAGIMAYDLKRKWFEALLRQDMAYYDIKDISGTASVISTNGAIYKKGLGRKLAAGFQFTVTFAGGLAYAFWASWRVSLMLLTTVPILAASTLFLVKLNQSQSARASAGYAAAGSIVQTTVASIRTILSLNAVQTVIDKFVAATENAYQSAIGLLVWIGVANGGMMAGMILGYIVIALYGAYVLYDAVRNTGCDASGAVNGATPCDPDAAAVFGALMGITFAASVLPQVSVAIEVLTEARAACYPALQVINRKVGDEGESSTTPEPTGPTRRGSTAALPPYIIDASSEAGVKLPSVSGRIEFQDTTFAYPTRLERNVMDGFSLTIEAGQTVALVGPSGCGKSTTVQLIERFYDPLGGAVKLDHYDLRHLNVHWLRQQIGLVSQEPTLFACSIRDNIAYGSPNATQKQIEEAARKANAHDFISSFPNGYETQVGDKGAHLSGGQKQRIAIARVLVKNPTILLLDEATSALDSESEQVVQAALDAVLREQKRTTLVIAHRLSTIRNCDKIVVVQDGLVVEQGTHDELIALGGEYFKLVQAQGSKDAAEAAIHSNDGASRRRTSYVDLESLDNGGNGSPVLVFRDVHFRYPARQDVEVFRGLSLSVREGETLALVGPSGHGKSTTIQLLERFYDPVSGSIELDGVDIKELNVTWYRNQFGLVGQEPVLFDISIAENIRFAFPEATQEQIESAARLANAHDFIKGFPDGYETQVGEGGTQVSGGQKQRIAIARALIRRPRFLLLDEATSALDSKSEQVVQAALDKIMSSQDLTTIVIAHRLSTIRNCDRIAVISDGKVREIGTHDELMQKEDGHYRRLQAFQNLEGGASLTGPLKPRAKASLRSSSRAIEDEGDVADKDGEVNKQQAKQIERRARLLARDDAGLFVVGGVGAFLTGLVFPGWGIIFAYVIELLYQPVFPCDEVVTDCQAYYNSIADDMQDKSFKVALGCVGLMIVSVLGGMLLFHAFGKASERILKRVRDSSFIALVRQEVTYFDLRPVGEITTQLEKDAAMIHAFSGEPIRTLIINLSSVLVGVVVSFVYMWPFALLCLATIPFMGFGAEMEMKLYLGEDDGDLGDIQEHSSGGIVVETLVNIRTVSSLTIEDMRSSEFSKALHEEDPTPIKSNFIKGCATGLGQFIQQWGVALMFWWGGFLLLHYPESFSYRDFLISMFALLFGLEGIGFAMQGATNREQAKEAAHRIFELTDRQSAIDPLSKDGKTVAPDRHLHPRLSNSSVSTLPRAVADLKETRKFSSERLAPRDGIPLDVAMSPVARRLSENADLHELQSKMHKHHQHHKGHGHKHHHRHHSDGDEQKGAQDYTKKHKHHQRRYSQP